jgi:hypothetical protein
MNCIEVVRYTMPPSLAQIVSSGMNDQRTCRSFWSCGADDKQLEQYWRFEMMPNYDEPMTCTRAKGTDRKSLECYSSTSSIVVTPHVVDSILSHRMSYIFKNCLISTSSPLLYLIRCCRSVNIRTTCLVEAMSKYLTWAAPSLPIKQVALWPHPSQLWSW